MNNQVTEICIVDENGNIFDTDIEYTIPIYQRGYSWEELQLTQLIEDIADVAENRKYYIGSLIVSKQHGRYEVVDGQQRLTSLYMLLSCLGVKVKPSLTFACREKSNYTLRNIGELLHNNHSILDMDRIDANIQRGVQILLNQLRKKEFNTDIIRQNLSKVVLYRIEVPENTDLNRYFEIMNTRGEQLEQHDILKAKLMSSLKDYEQELFAKIWNACSDMSGYVQMHFTSKNNTERKILFGENWNQIPENNWPDYRDLMKSDSISNESHKITDIINDNSFDSIYDADVKEARIRFESIIDFSYFLIHTLKVYISINNIELESESKTIMLDDKKLVDYFDTVINHGIHDGKRICNYEADFSKDFIICLLRTRYLFDKYIIKREYVSDSTDGEWSLKSLSVSNKKPCYTNSVFPNYDENKKENKNRINIMIQSALRVSYTSPKVMHWITRLLIWLSENNCRNTGNEFLSEYDKIAEQIAIEAVKKEFFDKCEDGNYAKGVNTPHIVFNYLDYLLWYDNCTKYDDFTFEFRNSVEHWYPQNPSEGTFESWKDGVDNFGNLCIVQRNINSKFSNMSPEAKKSTFKDMIAGGSIKLRIMSELTNGKDEKDANICWKEEMCRKHEEDMIKCLRKHVYAIQHLKI